MAEPPSQDMTQNSNQPSVSGPEYQNNQPQQTPIQQFPGQAYNSMQNVYGHNQMTMGAQTGQMQAMQPQQQNQQQHLNPSMISPIQQQQQQMQQQGGDSFYYRQMQMQQMQQQQQQQVQQHYQQHKAQQQSQNQQSSNKPQRNPSSQNTNEQQNRCPSVNDDTSSPIVNPLIQQNTAIQNNNNNNGNKSVNFISPGRPNSGLSNGPPSVPSSSNNQRYTQQLREISQKNRAAQQQDQQQQNQPQIQNVLDQPQPSPGNFSNPPSVMSQNLGTPQNNSQPNSQPQPVQNQLPYDNTQLLTNSPGPQLTANRIINSTQTSMPSQQMLQMQQQIHLHQKAQQVYNQSPQHGYLQNMGIQQQQQQQITQNQPISNPNSQKIPNKTPQVDPNKKPNNSKMTSKAQTNTSNPINNNPKPNSQLSQEGLKIKKEIEDLEYRRKENINNLTRKIQLILTDFADSPINKPNGMIITKTIYINTMDIYTKYLVTAFKYANKIGYKLKLKDMWDIAFSIIADFLLNFDNNTYRLLWHDRLLHSNTNIEHMLLLIERSIFETCEIAIEAENYFNEHYTKIDEKRENHDSGHENENEMADKSLVNNDGDDTKEEKGPSPKKPKLSPTTLKFHEADINLKEFRFSDFITQMFTAIDRMIKIQILESSLINDANRISFDNSFNNHNIPRQVNQHDQVFQNYVKLLKIVLQTATSVLKYLKILHYKSIRGFVRNFIHIVIRLKKLESFHVDSIKYFSRCSKDNPSNLQSLVDLVYKKFDEILRKCFDRRENLLPPYSSLISQRHATKIFQNHNLSGPNSEHNLESSNLTINETDYEKMPEHLSKLVENFNASFQKTGCIFKTMIDSKYIWPLPERLGMFKYYRYDDQEKNPHFEELISLGKDFDPDNNNNLNSSSSSKEAMERYVDVCKYLFLKSDSVTSIKTCFSIPENVALNDPNNNNRPIKIIIAIEKSMVNLLVEVYTFIISRKDQYHLKSEVETSQDFNNKIKSVTHELIISIAVLQWADMATIIEYLVLELRSRSQSVENSLSANKKTAVEYLCWILLQIYSKLLLQGFKLNIKHCQKLLELYQFFYQNENQTYVKNNQKIKETSPNFMYQISPLIFYLLISYSIFYNKVGKEIENSKSKILGKGQENDEIFSVVINNYSKTIQINKSNLHNLVPKYLSNLAEIFVENLSELENLSADTTAKSLKILLDSKYQILTLFKFSPIKYGKIVELTDYFAKALTEPKDEDFSTEIDQNTSTSSSNQNYVKLANHSRVLNAQLNEPLSSNFLRSLDIRNQINLTKQLGLYLSNWCEVSITRSAIKAKITNLDDDIRNTVTKDMPTEVLSPSFAILETYARLAECSSDLMKLITVKLLEILKNMISCEFWIGVSTVVEWFREVLLLLKKHKRFIFTLLSISQCRLRRLIKQIPNPLISQCRNFQISNGSYFSSHIFSLFSVNRRLILRSKLI